MRWHKKRKRDGLRTEAKAASYRGHLDSVSGTNLKGWIWRIDDLAPVTANVIIDGEVRGQLVASEIRGDLRRAGIGQGKHGFEWPIPDRYFDGLNHTFELETVEDGWRLQDLLSACLIFGELSLTGSRRLTGWYVQQSELPAEMRFFVDGVLVSISSPTDQVISGFEQKSNIPDVNIPGRWFDSREHEIWVEIVYVGLQSRRLGPIRQTLALEGNAIAGQVNGLQRNAIEGRVPRESGPNGGTDIALLVDGVEEARVRSDKNGVFSLPLNMLPVAEWLGSDVEVVCLPDRVQLSYAGRHLIGDALSLEIKDTEGSYIKGAVHSEFTLIGNFDLEVYDGSTKVAVTRIGERSPNLQLDFQLDLKSPSPRTENLRFIFNGVPVRRATGATATTPRPSGPSLRARAPAAFVPMNDPAVAARLQELALGQPKRQGDSDAPPITGAWRFIAPDQVQGWALDLASPNEPLSVTLYINGEPVQNAVAQEMTQPSEARISFEVPVGFTFFLPLLPEGCELEVRPDGGGSLAPHKSRVVRLEGYATGPSVSNELLTQTRETIDQHVRAQRLVEAYILSRRYAGAGVASIDSRHAVLDCALRTEWNGYEEVLASWHLRGRAPALADFLKSRFQAGKGRFPTIATDLSPLSGLGLPDCYVKFFETGETDVSEDASDEMLVAIEKHLLWRALQAGQPEEPLWPAPERASIVYALPNIELDPLFVRYLIEAASQGIGVVVVCDQLCENDATACALTAAGVIVRKREDAKSESLLERIGSREFAFASHVPQVYGAGALALWPDLLATHPAKFTVAEIASPLGLSLIGRVPDLQSAILRKPTPAGLLNFLESRKQTHEKAGDTGGIEISSCLLKIKPAAKPQLIVLHDFDPERELPILPPGVVAFQLNKRRISVKGKDHTFAAFSELMRETQGTDDQTPVAFLSSSLRYPENYLREGLRHWRVHRGEIRLSFCSLVYEEPPGSFTFVETRTPSLSFFALLAASYVFLRDISSLADESRRVESVVLTFDQPFLVMPLLDPTGPLRMTFQRVAQELDRSLTARQRGFVGSALGGKVDFAPVLPSSAMRLVAAITQKKIAILARAEAALALSAPGMPGVDEVESISSIGRRDLAERLLLKSVENPATILAAGRAEIENVLSSARFLGLQGAVASRLRPHAESIVNRFPQLLTPLFEFLATTLPDADYTAALFSCLPLLARWQDADVLWRFADLCRKYCSPAAFLTFLYWVDSSSLCDNLSRQRFALIAGDTIATDDAVPFTLPHSGLDLAFFRDSAPLERRIGRAVQTSDRAGLVALSDSLLARGSEGFRSLVRTLRSYSYELSEYHITLDEIGHSLLLSAREQLVVASVFDDKAFIARHLSKTAEIAADDALIAAATCTGNYAPLEEAYRRWAEKAGVAPIRFHGGSILSMFDGFSNAEAPALGSEAAEKVCVVMTVYNPDLDLMKSAIDSILRQTYPNFELLVIDDASDAVEADEIKSFAGMDKRISYLRTSCNRGPYIGRNRALEITNATYLAIQDADDYSHPQRLELQVSTLRSSPVLQGCTSAHLRIDRNAHLQFEHTLDILGDGTMSSMFRRSLFERLGGFAEVRSRGDVEFRTRIMSALGSHVIAHLECPLIFCYGTPGSLSNRTARNTSHFLSLFRGAVENLRHDPIVPGSRPGQLRPVPVPWPLAV